MRVFSHLSLWPRCSPSLFCPPRCWPCGLCFVSWPFPQGSHCLFALWWYHLCCKALFGTGPNSKAFRCVHDHYCRVWDTIKIKQTFNENYIYLNKEVLLVIRFWWSFFTVNLTLKFKNNFVLCWLPSQCASGVRIRTLWLGWAGLSCGWLQCWIPVQGVTGRTRHIWNHVSKCKTSFYTFKCGLKVPTLVCVSSLESPEALAPPLLPFIQLIWARGPSWIFSSIWGCVVRLIGVNRGYERGF